MQNAEHNLIENELIILSKATLDKIMKLDKWTDVLSLYMFYYYTGKWQKTNQPKASNSYCMKGMGWGEKRFQDAKNTLIETGLVEQITTKKSGKVTGWYMKLNYVWKKETIKNLEIEENHNPQSQAVVSEGTNALSANSVNALSTNILRDTSEKAQQKKVIPVKAQTPISRLGSLYLKLWRAKFGNVDQTLHWAKLSRLYKPYIETHGEYVIALCLITFFNWKGAGGDDQYLERRLQSACYPMDWLPTHINSMLPYIKNSMGIDVNDEKVVEGIINKKINELYD